MEPRCLPQDGTQPLFLVTRPPGAWNGSHSAAWDPVARTALTEHLLSQFSRAGGCLPTHSHTPDRAVSRWRPLQGRGPGGGFSPSPVAGGQQVSLPAAASACVPGTAAPRCRRGLLCPPPRLPRGSPAFATARLLTHRPPGWVLGAGALLPHLTLSGAAPCAGKA